MLIRNSGAKTCCLVAGLLTALPGHAEAAADPASARPSVQLPGAIITRLAEKGSTQPSWYFAAETDLNGDSVPELLVHVVGLFWCGTGGCTTFVFSVEADAYRELARIPLSRPPIRTARSTRHGWYPLIVGIGGGGVPAGDVAWYFDGASYAADRPLHRQTAVELADAVIHIDRYASWAAGTVLEPAPAGH